MRLRAQKFLLFSFAFSCGLTLETPRETQNEKLASQSIVSSSNETQNKPPDLDHGLNKRSAEIYPESINEEEEEKKPSFFEGKTPEKRTRLGFTGMRGKKEFTGDDGSGSAASGFDKRAFRSFSELFGGKRAPLAFHGMRGKKSEDFDDGEIFDPEAVVSFPRQEFLINTGLMDDPGEPSEFRPDEEPAEEEEALRKRSPYAFQGMRGKKEGAYDLKRAMGFLGMKGKKATEIWGPEGNYKRAPQTSFFGMKGKKAQSSGFFGMRGKKASPNAFFGIKGKRDPLGYDIQGFSLINQMKDSGSSRNRYRRGITWVNNSKKAKSAFFGIRGKKSAEES